MSWISEFKIAIITQNIDKIASLINNTPKFETETKAKEALALVSEATKIIDDSKNDLLVSMQKLKQTKKFLDS